MVFRSTIAGGSLLLASVLAAGCAPPGSDSGETGAAELPPLEFSVFRITGGGWVDLAWDVQWFVALRRDGTVVANDFQGPEGYVVQQVDLSVEGSTEGTEARSFCSGGFWPNCILGADGRMRYPPSYDGVEVSVADGSSKVAVFPYEMPLGVPHKLFACGLGLPGDACEGEPDAGVLDTTGLDDAVSHGVDIVASSKFIGVSAGSRVGLWDAEGPPRWFEIESSKLAVDGDLIIIDQDHQLWEVFHREAYLILTDVVAGTLSSYQTLDGYVWGTDVRPGADFADAPGVQLPGPADQIIGVLTYGCGLVDGDIWCWSTDGTSPLGDLVSPV